MTWVVQGLNSAGARVFLFSKTSRVAVGPTLPPIQWYRVSFQGVKCPEHEVGHSLLPVLTLRMSGALPMWSHGMDRDNFIFS